MVYCCHHHVGYLCDLQKFPDLTEILRSPLFQFSISYLVVLICFEGNEFSCCEGNWGGAGEAAASFYVIPGFEFSMTVYASSLVEFLK